MLEGNHIKITEQGLALASFKLKKGAIKLIVGANKESDYIYNGMGMHDNPSQHFQGPNGKDFINSMSFYKGALRFACHYVVAGKDQRNFTRAFYFLGRALHCIQDFYAHTNWVAKGSGNSVPWNEKMFPGLKLSECTTSQRLLDNAKWYNHKLFRKEKSEEKNREKEKEKEKWFEKMKNKKLMHPDMHLDYTYSFASKIIRDCSGHKKLGYNIANEAAVKHTTKAFNDFIRMVKIFAKSAKDADSLKNELMVYNPHIINWIKHRRAFAKAAQNHFSSHQGDLELKYI
jgi:hypothetical protein